MACIEFAGILHRRDKLNSLVSCCFILVKTHLFSFLSITENVVRNVHCMHYCKIWIFCSAL